MDLKHIKAFRTVAEELHFGRAARILRIAQPPLSRQIKELEQFLGARLFDRGPRFVRLTAAGTIFYARTTTVLADLERAIADAARAGQGAAGRLSLSFIHSSGYALLPAILQAYRRACPDVALDLHEMTILEQTEALRRGRIDLALLRPPLELPGVELVELTLDPFMLVVPASHRLAARDAASLSELKAEPFILFSRTTSVLFHTRINAMCYAAGFTPKIVQEATHIHTVLGLVQADYGVAIVPAIGRTIGVPGVKWLTIADAPAPVSVALAWRTEADAALVRGFRDVAVEVASRFATDGVVVPR